MSIVGRLHTNSVDRIEELLEKESQTGMRRQQDVRSLCLKKIPILFFVMATPLERHSTGNEKQLLLTADFCIFSTQKIFQICG